MRARVAAERVGERKALANGIEVAVMEPDAGTLARQELGRPDRVRMYCERLIEGLQPGASARDRRTSMNLYPRVMKLIGGAEDIADAIRELGFTSLQAGQRAAAAMSVVASPADTEREALEWIQSQRRLAGRPLLIDPEASDASVLES